MQQLFPRVKGEFKIVKHEYHESPKADESFKRLAATDLQKPRIAAAPKKQPKVKPAGMNKALEWFLLPRPCLRVVY